MARASTSSLGRKAAARRVGEFFNRNGCVRRPDPVRREAEGQLYKKGYEVRVGARDRKELALLQDYLRTLSLKPGKPYRKRTHFVLPIYGREAVAEFLRLIECGASNDPASALNAK